MLCHFIGADGRKEAPGLLSSAPAQVLQINLHMLRCHFLHTFHYLWIFSVSGPGEPLACLCSSANFWHSPSFALSRSVRLVPQFLMVAASHHYERERKAAPTVPPLLWSRFLSRAWRALSSLAWSAYSMVCCVGLMTAEGFILALQATYLSGGLCQYLSGGSLPASIQFGWSLTRMVTP